MKIVNKRIVENTEYDYKIKSRNYLSLSEYVEIQDERYELYWRNPASNILWKSSCTAAYLPSLKLPE